MIPDFYRRQGSQHCNVSVDGRICLETLDNWLPGHTLCQALTDIRELLLNPDPASPLDRLKASVYRDYVVDGNPAYIPAARKETHTLDNASESVETSNMISSPATTCLE